jgi:hypothetical protein
MLVILDNLKVIIIVSKWLGFSLSKILEKEKVLKNTKKFILSNKTYTIL